MDVKVSGLMLVLMCTLVDQSVADCNYYLVTGWKGVPDKQISASSAYDLYGTGPQRARLNVEEWIKNPTGKPANGAWSAAVLNTNQWIKVEFSSLKKVTGVVTRGRNSDIWNQWVKTYKVLYLNPSGIWKILPTTFTGNNDHDTPVVHMFNQPIYAKFVQINPLTWNTHISLRFDLIGCDAINPSN